MHYLERSLSVLLSVALVPSTAVVAQADASIQEDAIRYDLSALKGPQERVGDRVLQEHRESLRQVVDVYRGDQRVGQQKHSESCSYERVVQVLELGPSGYPRKLLLEYRGFRDLETQEEIPVSDIRIEMIKRESTWFGSALDGKPLPPRLDKRFSAELLERSGTPEISIVRDAALPNKPVAVGETWPIDPSVLLDRVSMFEYDADKSTTRGKLAAVRKDGDATWITLAFEVALVCEAINGRPFRSSTLLEAHLTLDVPLTGGPYCEKTMRFELEGVLEGEDPSTETRLSMKGERKVTCRSDAPAKKREESEAARK